MFKVYFINFGYYSTNMGSTLEEAIQIARKAGFQSAIYHPNGDIAGTWCPVVGWIRIQEDPK